MSSNILENNTIQHVAEYKKQNLVKHYDHYLNKVIKKHPFQTNHNIDNISLRSLMLLYMRNNPLVHMFNSSCLEYEGDAEKGVKRELNYEIMAKLGLVKLTNEITYAYAEGIDYYYKIELTSFGRKVAKHFLQKPKVLKQHYAAIRRTATPKIVVPLAVLTPILLAISMIFQPPIRDIIAIIAVIMGLSFCFLMIWYGAVRFYRVCSKNTFTAKQFMNFAKQNGQTKDSDEDYLKHIHAGVLFDDYK